MESGIDNPELIRTRLLRQHLATETARSQVDSRLEGRVSDFMAHKRQIHENYYVLTQKSDDITKVSKLLEKFSSVESPVEKQNSDLPCTVVSGDMNESLESDINGKETDLNEENDTTMPDQNIDMGNVSISYTAMIVYCK